MADSGRFPRAGPYLLLAIFALLPYLNVFLNDWTYYDDHALTQERSQVRLWSAESLQAIWTPGGNYVPLRDMVFLLDAVVFGESIRGYLLTNLLCHVAEVLALYALIQRLWGDAGIALAATLLFAAHPIHVEPVAWVAGSKDLMCLALSAGAVWAYVRGAWSHQRGRGTWALAVLLLLLALASKLAALGLPIVLAAVELCDPEPDRDSWRRRLRRWLPFALLTGVWFVLAVGPLRERALGVLGWGASPVAEPPERLIVAGAAAQRQDLYWPSVRAMVVVTWRYVAQWIWPTRLAALYMVPLEPSWLRPSVVAGLLGIFATLGGTVWLWWRGYRRMVFWMVWAMAFYLPVSNLMPVAALMNDRYIHMPSVAGSVLLGAGLVTLARRHGPRGLVARACLVGLVGGWAVCTVRQVTTWRSARTLWEHTDRVQPGNTRVHITLAGVALMEDRPTEAVQALLALEADAPDDLRRLLLLGRAYLASERPGAAIRTLERALRIYENEPLLLPQYAIALSEQGRHADALAQARLLLEQRPGGVQGHIIAGHSLAQLGNVEEAEAEFAAAARRVPPRSTLVLRAASQAFVQSPHPERALAYAAAWYAREPSAAAGLVYARALRAAKGPGEQLNVLLNELQDNYSDNSELQRELRELNR